MAVFHTLALALAQKFIHLLTRCNDRHRAAPSALRMSKRHRDTRLGI
ncbi:MAG: hypothetical protein JWM91_3263, partial [Rhodospirillales bacterium]|nr:hypothetical protein [Rhodospirillales bacterium]